MKFPPAATYRSRIANDVASSVVVPNRIAPRLSTLTVRADAGSPPMVVHRMPQRSQFARTRSQPRRPIHPDGVHPLGVALLRGFASWPALSSPWMRTGHQAGGAASSGRKIAGWLLADAGSLCVWRAMNAE